METTVPKLESHLGYWLRFVSNHVSHAFSRKLEAEGVTVAEWVVLRELLRLGPTAPSHLAETIGLTRGAVSKLVDRLVEKELLTRTAGVGDRRFQQVELTPAGRDLVPRLATLADQNDSEFFGHLSVEQREQLIALLQDLVRRHELGGRPIN